MLKRLDKPYDPKLVEEKIYELWEKSGYFNPDKLPGKRKNTFTIVLPPPNITGALHMGHALNATIQDILIRHKRMAGLKTLWLPGTDHAGIAAQNVVEKQLKKEGLNRHQLGKEKFLERVWQWKEKSGDKILDQLKKIGASLDWSRTRFTMDENYSEAVKTAFLHYYEKGWIYQADRIVNWCSRCATSLSDLELEYREEKNALYYLKYPLADKSGFITVATSRPETMLGDAAVAVNPKDKKYQRLIAKEAILPIQNRLIPVIADKVIDVNFGTGAVKVTPAHDLTDAEIGERHHLPVIKIIGANGRMTKEAGLICEGLKIHECRERIIEELKRQNLLEKEEPYIHNVAHCYRCDAVIEPIPSLQWFLKMDELAKKAIKAVKSGKIKFHPGRREKDYFNWLKNIKDWCVSRQVWWGHKIPIDGVDDVLDTWFSSALWPFAALGWPKKTKDLKQFYPTQVLSTARDIINLWVSRMIFSGLEFMGREPFKDVIIHATVLAKDGRRMSKSLGTGVDPMDLISQYGADATRFGLIWQVSENQDIRWDETAVIAGKKFANKIWNATRFVLMQTADSKLKINPAKIFQKRNSGLKNKKLTAADKKILKQLADVKKNIEKDLTNFRFGQALRKLYDFFWRDFCDIYIEKSKEQMSGAEYLESTKKILFHVIFESLKLLHPFMPFITEEIYQNLPVKTPKNKKMLIIEKW